MKMSNKVSLGVAVSTVLVLSVLLPASLVEANRHNPNPTTLTETAQTPTSYTYTFADKNGIRSIRLDYSGGISISHRYPCPESVALIVEKSITVKGRVHSLRAAQAIDCTGGDNPDGWDIGTFIGSLIEGWNIEQIDDKGLEHTPAYWKALAEAEEEEEQDSWILIIIVIISNGVVIGVIIILRRR